jgi:hypothetical protein
MFSQGESALHTNRVYLVRIDALILGLIGGIAGVYEVLLIFLEIIEQNYEKWSKR